MQTVLITGGSRGIGAETVRAFSRAGWRAAFTYLGSEEKAAALSRETGALALRCDARSEEETEKMARRVLRDFGHLDALICSAGTSWTGLLQDMTVPERIGRINQHNVGSAFQTKVLKTVVQQQQIAPEFFNRVLPRFHAILIDHHAHAGQIFRQQQRLVARFFVGQ